MSICSMLAPFSSKRLTFFKKRDVIKVYKYLNVPKLIGDGGKIIKKGQKMLKVTKILDLPHQDCPYKPPSPNMFDQTCQHVQYHSLA